MVSPIFIARAVDVLLASWFWKKQDCTISSLCGLALRQDPNVRTFNGYLGRLLNRIQPGHTESAIASDLAKAQAVLELLK